MPLSPIRGGGGSPLAWFVMPEQTTEQRVSHHLFVVPTVNIRATCEHT